MNKEALYRELNDGEWHSGQQLAQTFGVSRTQIWKGIAQLRETGVAIEANRGRGYRLSLAGIALFDEKELKRSIADSFKALLSEIRVRDVTGSTNEDCLSWLATRPSEKTGGGEILVVAERQTSGRGRRGKQWVSPYATSLYMSLSQRFDMGAAGLSGLSLVVGIAVAQAIEQFTEGDIALKWPNDIYINNQKLGGILLEVVGDISGPCHAVIGIGINIGMPEKDGNSIDQPFTTLANAFPQVQWDKNQLAGAIVNRLLELLDNFRQKGFESFIEEWSKRDFMCDQAVMLRAPAGDAEFGVHKGVNSDGALLVETSTGVRVYAGGEVSLRPAKL